MTEVLFYHLQNMSLESVLPPLLEKSLERGWRVVVQSTSPERTEELARGIVDRVCKSSGVEPEHVNVFKYLGSFAISAKPQFISELIEQPEVATAVANLR